MMRAHRIVLLIVFVATLIATAQAQEIEINPFGGGIVSSKVADTANFKNAAVYGLRWSVFVIPQFSLEAAVSRQDSFKFKDASADGRAYIFDLNGLYYFDRERVPGPPKKVAPFVTVGVGFLSADLKNPQFYVLSGSTATGVQVPPLSAPPGGRIVRLSDGDRFFTFNYGGGVLASRLAGPLGLRFDARGRTAPNLFGNGATFLEISGGFTINFEFPY